MTQVMILDTEEKASVISETPVVEKCPLVFGSAKSFLIHISDDFDEPLADFAEYM